MKRLPAILFAASAIVTPVPALGIQATQVSGRVLGNDGTPIAGAVITVADIRYSVRSDSLGVFRLSGTPGSTLNLSVTADGFRDGTVAIVLPRRGSLERDVILESESTPEPEVNPSDRVMRGVVMSTDGEPLSYANVQLNGGRRYVANDSGRFTLPMIPGAFTIVVRRIGFEPVEIKMPAMPDTAVQVRMTALATALPEQRITGRAAIVSLDLHGFYRRMADYENGGTRGYFITPEDLALQKPHNLTQMLETFPALRVNHSKLGPLYDILRGPNNCIMTVYLDGIRVIKGGFLDADADTSDFINRIAPVSHVGAVEIYARATQAPPQYQGENARCGVVLIWTR
jgi:hypothetical protein